MKIKKRRKDSKEVIQKMREWDALPIEEKLKKIEEMKKKGLKVYGEEGDDLIEEDRMENEN